MLVEEEVGLAVDSDRPVIHPVDRGGPDDRGGAIDSVDTILAVLAILAMPYGETLAVAHDDFVTFGGGSDADYVAVVLDCVDKRVYRLYVAVHAGEAALEVGHTVLDAVNLVPEVGVIVGTAGYDCGRRQQNER